MKEWYSPLDLIGLPGLPGTVHGLIVKAQAEHWPVRAPSVDAPLYPIWAFPRQARIILIRREIYKAVSWAASWATGDSKERMETYGLNRSMVAGITEELIRHLAGESTLEEARALVMARLECMDKETRYPVDRRQHADAAEDAWQRFQAESGHA